MTMKFKLLSTGVLSLGLGILSPVWADDADPKSDAPDIKIFEQLDKNADGKLDADEIPEDKKRFFDQLVRDADSDKDGVLTKSEYQTPSKEKTVSLPDGPGKGGRPQRDFGELFKRADKNGDGKLSLDEIPEKMATRLKPLMDKAGKDEVSLEDLEKLMNRRPGGGKGPKGSPSPGGKGGPPDIERIFDTADEDGDGKIYLKDVTDRGRMFLERAYDELGKDPDEAITLDELKEAMPPRPNGPPGGRPGRPPFGRGPDGDDPEMMADGEGDRPPFGPPGHPKFFVMLDKDEDGEISEDELEQLSSLFKELDEDEDGLLSLRELLGPPPHEREEMQEGEDMPRRPSRPRINPDSKPRVRKGPQNKPE